MQDKDATTKDNNRQKKYNACTEPCDVEIGPCCCGAWHILDTGDNNE